MNKQPVSKPVPQPLKGIPQPLWVPLFLPKLQAALSLRPHVIALALSMVAVTGVSLLFSAPEEMTSTAEQERIAAFEAASPLPLPTVNLADPAERQEAFQSLNLNPVQAKQLQTDLTQRGGRLVWIELFDDCQEDGDIVEIRSFYFNQEIPIFHAPRRVAVTLSPDERGIALTGIHDGGGGITVAVRENGRIVPLPRLRPGQTVVIPIL